MRIRCPECDEELWCNICGDPYEAPERLDPKAVAREISKQWSDSGDSVIESALFVLNRVLA